MGARHVHHGGRLADASQRTQLWVDGKMMIIGRHVQSLQGHGSWQLGVRAGLWTTVVVNVPVHLPPRAAEPNCDAPRVELFRGPVVQGTKLGRDNDVVRDVRCLRHEVLLDCLVEDLLRNDGARRADEGLREPPLLDECKARRDGDRNVRQARAESTQAEIGKVTRVIGPRKSRDTDLALLEVVYERIVVVARVHHVGGWNAVELAPNQPLDARPEIGTRPANVRVNLAEFERRRAVLKGMHEVVGAGMPTLEGPARAASELEVGPKPRPRGRV